MKHHFTADKICTFIMKPYKILSIFLGQGKGLKKNEKTTNYIDSRTFFGISLVLKLVSVLHEISHTTSLETFSMLWSIMATLWSSLYPE